MLKNCHSREGAIEKMMSSPHDTVHAEIAVVSMERHDRR